MERIKRLFKDEEGATMIEYALMVALIAVVLIGTITYLSGKVGGTFQQAGDAMPAAE